MKSILLKSFLMGAALISAADISAQDALLAFPGAEGFGRYATGGRGGEIYHVTNLNDSGAGSLRDAISKPNRIIVFDVSGVINIKSRLVFKNNLTILGQTAPGEGIQVYGNGVSFSNANNIIVRYLRVRMGVNGDNGKDAAGVAEGHDMIFDHMSVLWGRDENFSISSNNKGTGPSNVTIQNSIIGQGLQPHSCGGLIQTDNGVTLYRNLYIENKTRNPKSKGLTQFVNNVSYNWGNAAAYNMGGDSAGDSWAEITDNYWVKGPWKSASYPLTGGNDNYKYFASGNWYDSNIDGVLDGQEMSDEETAKSGGHRVYDKAQLVSLGAPKGMPEIEGRMSAPEALEYVLAYAGASLPVRDEVDQYLIDELASFGSLGSLDGISTEKSLPHKGTGALFGGYKPLDSDGDGIPDEWEAANGLDPNDKSDAAAIAANGYANIENYVFTIDSPYPYLKNPTELKAIKNEKTSVTLQWKNNADEDTDFVVEMSSDGKDFVEAGATVGGENMMKVEDLEENKQYYFRVYAVGAGNVRSVNSPVLSTMTSEPFLPDESSLVAPADGGDAKVLDVVLEWKNLTRDYFGTVSYNIYLGSSPEKLELLASELNETSFTPADLEVGQTYYWRVDAVNNTGATEGPVWSFKAVRGGTLFYTDFHTVPASFADSEWGTIIAGSQADILKAGSNGEAEFDNMVLGTKGGRIVAFGNLSPYTNYSSADAGASKNAVGFIGKNSKVETSYILIKEIPGPWTVTLFCGNSDSSAQSVMLSAEVDEDLDGVVDGTRDLATLKFKSSEKKTYKFTYTYEGDELTNVRIDRASITNKGINFHDIIIEQYVSGGDAVESIEAPSVPDIEVVGNAVSVNGLDGTRRVSVCDLSGRCLLSELPKAGSLGFTLPKGIFVINVEGTLPVKTAIK